MIVAATIKDLEVVVSIVHETIQEIYPNYYPKEVVDFFINHHKQENIKVDIENGSVFLIFEGDRVVGTGTIDGSSINRVFVLSGCQKKGYGSMLMDFLEKKVSLVYDRIYLDSSLPAFNIYIKRGYVPIEYHQEIVENGRVLCYPLMAKEAYNNNQ